ncbi:DUF389 domain-containing protein [Lyngbya confervoides]|uniref:DUF389 domain-containing protein n=1 Tax=Lyngbya confervoides BDU141951 TaxID=1574623 RepID=A0ABD4T7Y9_9CYAN|nr:DUF389 domain-containing protein [Lyngbya confervoides]MCM1984843.1 DUF389 domain-containing protein [Lyngbya confervoides BDU141951]
MTSSNSSNSNHKFRFRPIRMIRHWFALNLGVDQNRKLEIYQDLLKSVSLRDSSYWLQVLFSAGIATLGLALNSPAVVIGAMLISPLMGPILATGMAFAVGDLVFALRALLCLSLSCFMAVGFAMILIAILPFKDQTAEILARTEPNLLDLVIALFSGALGTIATAKEAKGVVTSIPGVAIAVALMPPLCVVGYGIGLGVSLQSLAGLRIAAGGGLLFITNLTAITLMAMLVFLIIRVDTPLIKRQAEEWHRNDPESKWMQRLFESLPGMNRLEVIGSVRNRFIVLLIPILALMFPLGQSLGQLQSEVLTRQRQNFINSEIQSIWEDGFAKQVQQDGQEEERAQIDTLDTTVENAKVFVKMRVFTKRDFTAAEEQTFAQRLADRLNKRKGDISVQLIQIPTSASSLLNPFRQPTPETPDIKSVAETQAELWSLVTASLKSLEFPPGTHQLLGYGIRLYDSSRLTVEIAYLSDRPLDPDGEYFLSDNIRSRLQLPQAQVRLQHIPRQFQNLSFNPEQTTLTPAAKQTLRNIAGQLKTYENLQLLLRSQVPPAEQAAPPSPESDGDPPFPLANLRIEAIQDHLNLVEGIDRNRIQVSGPPEVQEEGSNPKVQLVLQIKPPNAPNPREQPEPPPPEADRPDPNPS